MSDTPINNIVVPTINDIAQEISNSDKKILLIYAFNGTGKTRLSVAFKDLTKSLNNNTHVGIYYNAYSEDLFYWNNDEENNGQDIHLLIQISSLNQYHALLNENNLRSKLSLYKPKYDFVFKFHDEDVKLGIHSIRFFIKKDTTKDEDIEFIKISRGEEQTFIWCFFLALFEIEGWSGQRSNHFFIDDPVSSLDEHNIFVTASSLMNLIDSHHRHKKIIITTHHVGFFAILADWLTKGEKSSSYKNHTQINILKNSNGIINLVNPNRDVFLYHLEILQTVRNAINARELYAYHFALLRQVLENISSFLGVGRISYVLEQIGINDQDEVARIVNTLSHKNVFRYEAIEMVEDNVTLFTNIFNALMNKYSFVIH